tara:strand:- start:5769 stop:6092 length:324 start_codon:yes stop_codon:yes gene_type:complete
MKLLKIVPSSAKGKKLSAVFEVDGKQKTINFGSVGYRDYTLISNTGSKFYLKDLAERKKVKTAYINRHKKNEDWTNPMTAGALSKNILWNLPTRSASIKAFKKRFNL